MSLVLLFQGLPLTVVAGTVAPTSRTGVVAPVEKQGQS